MDILLIHPPAAKPAEPPLGTAVLLSHLRCKGVGAEAVDANIEAFLYLLDADRLSCSAGEAPPTVLRRAIKNVPRSLDLLRSDLATSSFARYGAAVRHLNEALNVYGREGSSERLSLGDYRHKDISPFVPADLKRLATGGTSTLFRDYYREQLLPRIADLRPRSVAITVNYLHQVLPAFELAGLIRSRFPEIPIVGGGGMFSSWRSRLWEMGSPLPPFTRIVFGPGEKALADLATGKEGPPPLLDGSGDICFTPDFDFAGIADYLSPRPVLPVSASRGCYWRRCLFCPEAASPTQPYACVPPSTFPDLLLSLSRQYGATDFHVTDNAIPVPILRALAARKDDLKGISWHGFVRFEKEFLDSAFLSDLYLGGCRMLQLGLESGSQRVLDRLGKGTRLDDAGRILKSLYDAGIASYVYVMLGMPGETEEDAEETLAFIEAHAEVIGFLNLSIMNLPRDSAMLEDASRFGIETSSLLDEGEPLGLYRSFKSVGVWDRGAARRFLDRRLLGSPKIREIVNRTPPLFTSNHAHFFSWAHHSQ